MGLPITVLCGDANKQIPVARVQFYRALLPVGLCPGIQTGHRAEFSIVQHLKFHPGPGHRAALLIHHLHLHLSRRRIQGHVIELGGHIGPFRHRLQGLVFSKPHGIYQHGPGGRSRKPPAVQTVSRLASPEKVPFSVAPGLHPGVVVVTVSPPGSSHLPGRDPQASQSCGHERRLLTAPSRPGPEHGQRILGAGEGGLVGGIFSAPAVGLHNGVVHALSLDPPLQPVIEKPSGIRNVLVVNPVVKHIVGKQLLRHLSPIGPLRPQVHPMPGIGQVQGRRIVQKVAQGHGAVQEP